MTDTLARLNTALAGRYHLDRELGAGGMATVYLAHDLKHDRQVAVKVLRPELAAQVGAERFLAEIRVTARLQHPHILPLHDSGVADGFLYYVMPYVEGESLRDRLRHGELPVAEAIRILRDVTDALAAAHAHGVIHRDIKPENVLLTGRHAVVADFGVAKALSEATGRHAKLTTAGFALGTPAYMAPEQAAADPNVDHRADLYAVGVMGYELLTGRPPFTADSAAALLAAHVTQVPEAITTRRPTIPVGLAEAIMRCLEKRPADRWQRAEDLVARLETVLTPDGTASVPSRPRPRPRWLAPALGVTALLLAAAGLLFLRPSAERRVPSAERRVPSSITRLAVLPLRNATGDTADAILAEGLTREMISSLTRAGVKVIGFASVARYAGAEPDFDRVARDLNVDGVAVGSLVRMAGGLSIALELADPVTKENRWAGSYDVTSADVSLLAGRAAREMAAVILGGPTGSPDRPAGSNRSINPAAYQAYLLGKHYLDRASRAGFLAAIEQFERAIGLDSTFAVAYGALGFAYANGAAIYQWLPGEQAFPGAERAIGKALDLDPQDMGTYLARGTLRYARDWDWKGAEADLRAALEIEPTALGYNVIGELFDRIGATREAVTAYEQAVALEPTAVSRASLAWGLINTGEVAAARRELDAASAVDSSYAEIHARLAYVLGAEGHPQAGLAELDDYERRVGGPGPFHSVRGWLLAMQEPKAAAEARYQAMVKDGERLGPFVLGLAAAATVLGKYDEAIHWLEFAAEKRALTSPGLPWTKPLRQDPRFREVFRKAGIDVTRWDRQAPPDPAAPR